MNHPTVAPDDHAAWLVAQIGDLFVQYDENPGNDTLDKLYVLIGALKIVGLDEAHRLMRVKLLSLPAAGPADSVDSGPDTPGGDELSVRTSSFLHRVEIATRLLRPAESAQVAAQLLRPKAPIIAIVGDSGVGRTALLHEIAGRLAETEHAMPVWRLAPGAVLTRPQSALKMALEDMKSPGVIVIDDLDIVADLGTQDPDRGLLEIISEARFHLHARIVLVINRRRLSRLGVLNQALDEWMFMVSVGSLAPRELVEVVNDRAQTNANEVGLSLGEGVIDAALAPAESTSTIVHPGLAISRIDAAIGRALLERSKVIDIEHLSPLDSARAVETELRDLTGVLRARVRGQDEAIATVANRLTLTRAGLDLRPQRPNGVFLFAGPTGVGKTELATQIAIAEYGSADALIRLDMSEYGEYEFGLTRLIGVGQGYVGNADSDGWLTTKVVRRPRSVILLDEIEKAHQSVWNTFLQVFDAGRLTDGRGVTASFADTIVIMTSNIGVRESNKRAIGFGDVEGNRSAERQLAAIKDSMAPELINRLDDVVLFNPLTTDVIIEIAGVELAATKARLAAAGWRIEYDESVPQWLATTNYDPTYGARHLMRNIEREFLGKLAKANGRNVWVTATDRGIDFVVRDDLASPPV